ncbi:uncharacterized protein LOC143839552 [Paroedura picta]|uniref:uncharacterized protein LOC143839552 n=1 Tax=Paroedura picta TaxID=143630 RepID=UPI004055A61A
MAGAGGPVVPGKGGVERALLTSPFLRRETRAAPARPRLLSARDRNRGQPGTERAKPPRRSAGRLHLQSRRPRGRSVASPPPSGEHGGGARIEALRGGKATPVWFGNGRWSLRGETPRAAAAGQPRRRLVHSRRHTGRAPKSECGPCLRQQGLVQGASFPFWLAIFTIKEAEQPAVKINSIQHFSTRFHKVQKEQE